MPLRDFAAAARDSGHKREVKVTAAFHLKNPGDHTEPAMYAKELVLADVDVAYVLFPELQRRLRAGRYPEERTGVQPIYGAGALVVPRIPPVPREQLEQGEYAEAVAFLMQSAYEGLIIGIGIDQQVPKGLHYPESLLHFIDSTAQLFEA